MTKLERFPGWNGMKDYGYQVQWAERTNSYTRKDLEETIAEPGTYVFP